MDTLRRTRIIVSMLMLAGIAAPLPAQVTTGQIEGIVSDEGGAPLPGVRVTATSASLQGARAYMTDNSGHYVLPVLPTGRYTLEFSLPGHATVRVEDVLVQLGGMTTEDIQLKEGEIVETVTVTASTPLINAKTADTGLNVSSEVLDTLPVATRNFQELAKLVPSATSVELNTTSGDRNGWPSIRGEGQYGDNYLIDGLTVRDPAVKDTATPLPFDAIDEVQIVTDGFSPEYGQALGGLINAITRSGSNSIDGEVAYMYQSDKTTADYEQTILATPTEFDDSTAYGNLGGPIQKDKLWYFLSYNRDEFGDTFAPVSKGAFGLLPEANIETESDTAFGKLTWTLNPKHSFSANYTWRDLFTEGLDAEAATPEARQNQDVTDTRLRVNYQALFSANSILEVKFGHVYREGDTGPITGSLGPAAYNLESFGVRINNTERRTLDERNRDDYAAIFTQFWNPGGRGGSHEFKAGVEYHEPEQISQDIWAGLDEDVFTIGANPDGADFGLPDTFNTGASFSFIETSTGSPFPILVPSVLNEYRTNPAQRNRSEEWGVFLQDRMEFGRWNIMLGVRADRQEGFNDADEVFAEYGFGEALSPRGYVTWDATGNGKNIVKTGWGRFYDVNGTRFGEFANTQGNFNFRNYDWRPLGATEEDYRLHIDDGSVYDIHNPDNWTFGLEQSPDSAPISYDQVKGPAQVERFLLEYDRLIMNDYAFKVRYVSSKARELIDDINYLSMFDGPLNFVVQNTDLKRRDYDSFEVEFNGTPSPIVAFNASWVHSASKGTSPGQFETDGFLGTTGSSNDIGVFLDKPESNPQFWCGFYTPVNGTCVPTSWATSATPWLRDYNNDDVMNEFDRDLERQTLFDGLGSTQGDDGWYGDLPYAIDDLFKLYGRFTIEKWGNAYVTGFAQWASGYHTQRRGLQHAYGSYLTFEEIFTFEFVGACTSFADCDAVQVQNPVAGTGFSDESGETRGSRENSSFWTLDLAIGKVWNVSKGYGIETRLEAFNLTDNQVPLAVQDRAVSEFGEPLRRQAPRSYRLFALFSF